MKNYKIINSRYRYIIYSFAITICIFILMNILNQSIELFWISAGFTFILLITEFVITSNIFRVQTFDNSNTTALGQNKTVQMLHHLFLPAIFYWSTIFFIFSNRENYIQLIILVISFVIHALLIKNTIAFYDDDLKTKSVNYFFDLTTIILFFYIAEILVTNFHSQNTITLIGFIISAFIFIFLNYLTILRHHHTKESFVFFLLFSIVEILALIVIIGSLNIAPLIAGLVLGLTYFLYASVINQMIEGHKLYDVLVETLIVILLIFALLQFSLS